MKAQSIFLSCVFVLLLMNVYLWLSGSSNFVQDIVGGVIGLVVAAATGAVIGGLNILGSGLTSASVKILFGLIALGLLLFQIPIPGFPIGLGLASNVISIFISAMISSGDVFALFGFVISLLMSLMALVSGMIVIVGGGSSE
ncbi:MAG: hypothetical protein QXE92_03445 [Thermofilaceae archaeon]